MNAQPEINITLSVSPVARGGNSPCGRYLYNFSQQIIKVDKSSNIVVDLEKSKQFKLEGFKVTRVSESPFNEASLDSKKIVIDDLDTSDQNAIYDLTIKVRDTENNALILCDPQVKNDTTDE